MSATDTCSCPTLRGGRKRMWIDFVFKPNLGTRIFFIFRHLLGNIVNDKWGTHWFVFPNLQFSHQVRTFLRPSPRWFSPHAHVIAGTMPPRAKNGVGGGMLLYWEDKANHNQLYTYIKSECLWIIAHPLFVRSYGDASIESLKSDTFRIFIGYLIMFAYTVVMLGRPNLVENRDLLQDGQSSGFVSPLFSAKYLYYVAYFGGRLVPWPWRSQDSRNLEPSYRVSKSSLDK